MSEEIRKKDAGPDELRKLSRDTEDTEGHKKDSGEDPLSATARRPLAIPETEDDTEGHRK